MIYVVKYPSFITSCRGQYSRKKKTKKDKNKKKKTNKQTEQKICNGLKDILVTKTMKYEL